MTFTARVQSILAATFGRIKYRYSRKHCSLSVRDLRSTGRHLLGAAFIARINPNLCKTLRTQYKTENNCINSQAQNTTALQPNVFLTGIRQLMVTSANYCQGQLQTPHSLSVITSQLDGKMFLQTLTFRRRIKSRLPFAGIIRGLPYSTRFQDKG